MLNREPFFIKSWVWVVCEIPLAEIYWWRYDVIDLSQEEIKTQWGKLNKQRVDGILKVVLMVACCMLPTDCVVMLVQWVSIEWITSRNLAVRTMKDRTHDTMVESSKQRKYAFKRIQFRIDVVASPKYVYTLYVGRYWTQTFVHGTYFIKMGELFCLDKIIVCPWQIHVVPVTS